METLRVTLDKLVYAPELEAPPDRPHPFAYHLTLENLSEETVTIQGRKWVITDQHGRRMVTEGEGLLGKKPRLRPGERFSYHSYHTIATDSVAEGALLALNEAGKHIVVRIPRFEMSIPV